MKVSANMLAACGTVLVIVSAYPLALIARESWAARQTASRFTFQPEYESLEISDQGHRLIITDAFKAGKFQNDDQRIGPVKIMVDGKDYSDASQVEIRPAFHDANRYHGWLVLGRLFDKRTNQTSLAVGQRTLGDTLKTGRRSGAPETEFRILRMRGEGTVEEERFGLDQRTDPLYRTIFVRFLYPQPMGFHSQILQGWPTVAFPIVYPIITSIAGFILLGLGVARRRAYA